MTYYKIFNIAKIIAIVYGILNLLFWLPFLFTPPTAVFALFVLIPLALHFVLLIVGIIFTFLYKKRLRANFILLAAIAFLLSWISSFLVNYIFFRIPLIISILMFISFYMQRKNSIAN